MSAMDDALRDLVELNGQVTSQIIKDLIEDHAPHRARMMKLYERYQATKEGVPIFSREFTSNEAANKINNKLNNAFDAEIVDTKIGYFMGYPVLYGYDMEDGKEGKSDAIQRVIDRFNNRNNYDDLDAETAKLAAICGYAGRLYWIEKGTGEERAMLVKPWECIFIMDRSLDAPQYAMRYYPVTIKDGSGEREVIRVEWYDETTVTFYIEDKGEFIIDSTEVAKAHLFDYVPLVQFLNNAEAKGDAEKVLALIDGFDRTLSDQNSEIESFRSAYMKFVGTMPTKETIEAARQTGAFGMDEDSDVSFITKDLPTEFIEKHLDRLEALILRFAQSVNFSDESFGTSISGVAMKFKLFALETKSMYAERKFTAALRQQFRILASSWNKKGIAFDPSKVWFQFKRNVPVNLLEEAQTQLALKGLISERTRLGLFSAIDNVDYEITQMEEDAANAALNLDDEGGATGGE